ncbi:MAG: T9SS type A sorting domain-containing protein [candidate division Zixibacteria bacterium]|nr:T9SS type A sorting domain-containing protein [candidate division Zixibacteria bacterium]
MNKPRLISITLLALLMCGAYAYAQEQEVVISPIDPPINVPCGGDFLYDLTVINHADSTVRIDGWTGLTLPNGNSYGPLCVRHRWPFLSDSTVTFHNIPRHVPSYAPLGEYYFIFYIGDYPIITDSHYFEFTVIEGDFTDNQRWDLFRYEEEYNTRDLTDVISNYPNPFNATTTISFELSQAGNVNLDIYNLAGQKVESLVKGYKGAGVYTANWDASNNSSGIYLYRLKIGENSITKRMTLLK